MGLTGEQITMEQTLTEQLAEMEKRLMLVQNIATALFTVAELSQVGLERIIEATLAKED